MAFLGRDQALSGRLHCITSHQEYELLPSLTRVGRHRLNDLVFEGPGISNFHCDLDLRPGLGLLLTDYSTNGTRINEKRVDRDTYRIVRPGDTISFGVGDTHKYVYLENDMAVPSSGVWSRYASDLKLGSGTFGSVYRCRERKTHSLYAIKVIDRGQFHFVQDSETMFDREVQILTALKCNHEHIVQLKEVFDETPMLYLVLEYVPGGDLGRYLQKHAPLSENVSVELMTQICKGVAFIHEQGVVHRDLKPENLLMMSTKPLKIKIADFGLAKVIEGGTSLKTRCGTPNYLAPEVAQSSNNGPGYDQKSDSWSAGVIAFEMLTNKLPYQRNASPQIDFWSYPSQRVLDLQALSQFNCSTQSISFINGLLREAPNARITIFRALKHEWLSPTPLQDLHGHFPNMKTRRLARPPPRIRKFPPPQGRCNLLYLLIPVSALFFVVLYETMASKEDGLQGPLVDAL